MVLVPKYTIPMDKLELSLERICQSETTNNRLLHPIQTKRGYKPMKVIFQCPIIEPVSYRITLPCHPIKQSNSSHLMLKPNPLCLELLNWSHKLLCGLLLSILHYHSGIAFNCYSISSCSFTNMNYIPDCQCLRKHWWTIVHFKGPCCSKIPSSFLSSAAAKALQYPSTASTFNFSQCFWSGIHS